MRYSLLASFARSLALASLVTVAGSTVTLAAERTVYLSSLVLEDLKQSNPGHYAKARQIMDAAAELCRPGAPQIQKVEGQLEVSCSGALLKTSNPPKRQISFVLGDTRYIALVTMKDAAPTAIPAGQDETPAVKPAK